MAGDESGVQLFTDAAGRLYLIFGDSLEGYCLPDERRRDMEARLRRGPASAAGAPGKRQRQYGRQARIGSLRPCDEQAPAVRSDVN